MERFRHSVLRRDGRRDRLNAPGGGQRLTVEEGSATHRRPDGSVGDSGLSRSSRGPGHRPFTAVTRVRISYGTPIKSERYRSLRSFCPISVQYPLMDIVGTPWMLMIAARVELDAAA
jgi:hypothetical protein